MFLGGDYIMLKLAWKIIAGLVAMQVLFGACAYMLINKPSTKRELPMSEEEFFREWKRRDAEWKEQKREIEEHRAKVEEEIAKMKAKYGRT